MFWLLQGYIVGSCIVQMLAFVFYSSTKGPTISKHTENRKMSQKNKQKSAQCAKIKRPLQLMYSNVSLALPDRPLLK